MAAPSASSSLLPPFDGLSPDFGFVLIRRIVSPGEPKEHPSVAWALARDSEGRTVSVALKQPNRSVAVARVLKKSPDPAELPHFISKVNTRNHAPARDLAVAAVGDHVLLLIGGELFLYDSEELGLPRLRLLPPHPRSPRFPLPGNWHSHRVTTTVVRLDDTVAVVSLRPPQLDSAGWGHLLRWFSSTGKWELKPLVVLPGANIMMTANRIDSTVALGNGRVCWTDFSVGMVVLDVFEEDPSITYIPFPGHGLYRRNTVCYVDGQVTLIATEKNPTLGYEFLLFDLDMDTAVWAKKSVIHIPWASEFCPWFPTVNSQDPRLLYFLEKGPSGERWYLHGVNTKSKKLSMSREQVRISCNNEEISETAPWVCIQLSTANKGEPLPKIQRTT